MPLGGDRYSFVDRTNQQFHVKPVGFSKFYQISASNAPEKVLEADPATNPEKTIQQCWPDGGLYEQFWFEPV